MEKEIALLKAENAHLKNELARKDKIIAGLQQRFFGSSSEKLDPAQLQLLFDEMFMGKPAPLPEGVRRNIRTGGGKTKRPNKPPHQGRAFPQEPDDPH